MLWLLVLHRWADCNYNSSYHNVPVVSSQCVGSYNELICECFNKLKRDSLSLLLIFETFRKISASSFVEHFFFAEGERAINFELKVHKFSYRSKNIHTAVVSHLKKLSSVHEKESTTHTRVLRSRSELLELYENHSTQHIIKEDISQIHAVFNFNFIFIKDWKLMRFELPSYSIILLLRWGEN